MTAAALIAGATGGDSLFVHCPDYHLAADPGNCPRSCVKQTSMPKWIERAFQLQKVVPPIVLQVAVRPKPSLMKVVLPIRLTVADDPS